MNSSITTLSVLDKMTLFATNGVPYSYEGGEYAVVIANNPNLADLYVLLGIQTSSTLGTYIGNNPSLCFDAALSWTRRSDSNLSFVSSQV